MLQKCKDDISVFLCSDDLFVTVTSACMLLTTMLDICQIKKTKPQLNLEEVIFYSQNIFITIHWIFRNTTVLKVWPRPNCQPMRNVCWDLNLVNIICFMSRFTLLLTNCGMMMIIIFVNNKYFCINWMSDGAKRHIDSKSLIWDKRLIIACTIFFVNVTQN